MDAHFCYIKENQALINHNCDKSHNYEKVLIDSQNLWDCKTKTWLDMFKFVLMIFFKIISFYLMILTKLKLWQKVISVVSHNFDFLYNNYDTCMIFFLI